MSPVEGVNLGSLIAYQCVVNKNFILLILDWLKIDKLGIIMGRA